MALEPAAQAVTGLELESLAPVWMAESGGHVGNHHRDRKGADAGGTPFEQDFVLVFHNLESADPRSEHDTDLFRVEVVDV